MEYVWIGCALQYDWLVNRCARLYCMAVGWVILPSCAVNLRLASVCFVCSRSYVARRVSAMRHSFICVFTFSKLYSCVCSIRERVRCVFENDMCFFCCCCWSLPLCKTSICFSFCEFAIDCFSNVVYFTLFKSNEIEKNKFISRKFPDFWKVSIGICRSFSIR